MIRFRPRHTLVSKDRKRCAAARLLATGPAERRIQVIATVHEDGPGFDAPAEFGVHFHRGSDPYGKDALFRVAECDRFLAVRSDPNVKVDPAFLAFDAKRDPSHVRTDLVAIGGDPVIFRNQQRGGSNPPVSIELSAQIPKPAALGPALAAVTPPRTSGHSPATPSGTSSV